MHLFCFLVKRGHLSFKAFREALSVSVLSRYHYDSLQIGARASKMRVMIFPVIEPIDYESLFETPFPFGEDVIEAECTDDDILRDTARMDAIMKKINEDGSYRPSVFMQTTVAPQDGNSAS